MRGCSCRGTAGFAHVSVWRKAKILVAGGEENNLDDKAKTARWHGGMSAACVSKSITASCGARSGGRAGRRTWAGRKRTKIGACAMKQLDKKRAVYHLQNYHEEALSVQEAQLSMLRRLLVAARTRNTDARRRRAEQSLKLHPRALTNSPDLGRLRRGQQHPARRLLPKVEL